MTTTPISKERVASLMRWLDGLVPPHWHNGANYQDLITILRAYQQSIGRVEKGGDTIGGFRVKLDPSMPPNAIRFENPAPTAEDEK